MVNGGGGGGGSDDDDDDSPDALRGEAATAAVLKLSHTSITWVPMKRRER
jgi:hypothetical protein